MPDVADLRRPVFRLLDYAPVAGIVAGLLGAWLLVAFLSLLSAQLAGAQPGSHRQEVPLTPEPPPFDSGR
jgi:hypothetical protein